MVTTISGITDTSEIDAAVRSVQSAFSPRVVRIRYSLKDNYHGDPSVYFRIVVRDEDTPVDRLVELYDRLSVALTNEARTYENGLQAYFSFRSASEQEKLREPAWD